MTVLGVLFASALSAQEDAGTVFKKLLEENKNNGIPATPGINTFHNRPVISPAQSSDTAKLVTILSNGNRMYALPQDNMPCIVPKKQVYAMPFGSRIAIIPPPAQKSHVPGRIPNPATTLVIPVQKMPSR